MVVQAGYLAARSCSSATTSRVHPQGSAYGSIYFTLLFAHHAHVLLGLAARHVLLWKLARHGVTNYWLIGVRGLALYWYVVSGARRGRRVHRPVAVAMTRHAAPSAGVVRGPRRRRGVGGAVRRRPGVRVRTVQRPAGRWQFPVARGSQRWPWRDRGGARRELGARGHLPPHARAEDDPTQWPSPRPGTGPATRWRACISWPSSGSRQPLALAIMLMSGDRRPPARGLPPVMSRGAHRLRRARRSLLALVFGAPAAAQPPERDRAARRPSRRGRTVALGRELFDGNCASCHGIAGRGIGVAAPRRRRTSAAGRRCAASARWRPTSICGPAHAARRHPHQPSTDRVLFRRKEIRVADRLRRLARPGARDTAPPPGAREHR